MILCLPCNIELPVRENGNQSSEILVRQPPISTHVSPWYRVYPVPQNAPCVSAGMNVPDSLQGLCPKATGVSPWYGVYFVVGLVRNS